MACVVFIMIVQYTVACIRKLRYKWIAIVIPCKMHDGVVRHSSDVYVLQILMYESVAQYSAPCSITFATFHARFANLCKYVMYCNVIYRGLNRSHIYKPQWQDITKTLYWYPAHHLSWARHHQQKHNNRKQISIPFRCMSSEFCQG